MTGTTEARPSTDGALLRYRVMAYVVGTLLVVLVCVAVPLKYAAGSPTLVTVVGIAHGYLFMVMLATVGDLWRRRRFPLAWAVLMGVAGLVPFLTFVAEHEATKRIRDGRF